MAATIYALFHSRMIFQPFFREAIWLSPYVLRFTSGNLLFPGKNVSWLNMSLTLLKWIRNKDIP